ncbi:uncharacterized protein [Periplaneta americana]|uniref:uncharacterized protein n=1 Tax=Periplaneta americana TaxID=6978 RepID=UPI0037E98357
MASNERKDEDMIGDDDVFIMNDPTEPAEKFHKIVLPTLDRTALVGHRVLQAAADVRPIPTAIRESVESENVALHSPTQNSDNEDRNFRVERSSPSHNISTSRAKDSHKFPSNDGCRA